MIIEEMKIMIGIDRTTAETTEIIEENQGLDLDPDQLIGQLIDLKIKAMFCTLVT